MLIRELPVKVVDRDATYAVRICGDERFDGTWEAWLEFHPRDKRGSVLPQPNLTAVEYWADGLHPIYIEGALARAQGRLP